MKPLLDKPVPFYARRSMGATALGPAIYFLGGVGANNRSESILDVSGELWVFDTENMSWSAVNIGGDLSPPPRRCAGWLGCRSNIYLWGGSGLKPDTTGQTTYSFLNDLWLFSPGDQTWCRLESTDDHVACPHENPVQPPPRYTPVFYEHKGRLFVFGGYTEDKLGKRKMNDLWLRAGSGAWTEIDRLGLRMGYTHGDDWPGVRYGCMSAGNKDKVYLCGGFSDAGDHIDVWAFDCSATKWRILAPDEAGTDFPERRYCAAMALYGDHIYLFGGRSRRYPKCNFNDLWRFSITSCQWEQLSASTTVHNYDGSSGSPGYHAKAAVTVAGDYMYLWGGEGLHGHVSDFWRFDMMTCVWELIQEARNDDPVFW